jgi:hypothetical protein
LKPDFHFIGSIKGLNQALSSYGSTAFNLDSPTEDDEDDEEVDELKERDHEDHAEEEKRHEDAEHRHQHGVVARVEFEEGTF